MPVTPLTGLRRVTFRRRALQPPTAFYVTTDEFINIRTVSHDLAPGLYLRIRLLTPNGDVVEIERTFTVAAIFRYGEWNVRLLEGFLLSVACSVDTIIQRGVQWVRVELRHGDPREISPARVLISNYLQHEVPISWPEGPQRNPLDGRGYTHHGLTTIPTAGNPIEQYTPTYGRWKVHSLTAILQTSAAVANRYGNIYLLVDGEIVYAAQTATAQLASTTQRYNFSTAFGNYWFAYNSHHIPLPPDLLLPGGSIIRFTVTAMDAADDFTDGAMIVEEWQTPY